MELKFSLEKSCTTLQLKIRHTNLHGIYLSVLLYSLHYTTELKICWNNQWGTIMFFLEFYFSRAQLL